MNVLFLRSTFHAGGTENLIVRIFNEPIKKFNLELILLKSGSMEEYLNENKLSRVTKIERKGKFDLSLILKLHKFVKKNNISIIHTHQEIELVYAVLLKLIYPKIKLVHHIHLHNPSKGFWFSFERYSVNKICSKTIAVSHTLKRYLRDNGFNSERIIVLNNIIEKTNNILDSDKEELLNKYNFNKSNFNIVMVGNFVREKDQMTLAKAIMKIKNKNTNLYFIGKESNYSDEIKKIVEEEYKARIHFLSQVPNAVEYLKYFNLVVFSSKSETFGMAALEALLLEVPVLASDIPVMKELSKDGKYFQLFKTGDEFDLAEKMELLINNITNYNIDQKEAKNHVEKEFSSKVYVDNLYSLYNNVTE